MVAPDRHRAVLAGIGALGAQVTQISVTARPPHSGAGGAELRVRILAADPISRLGIAGQLQARPDVLVVAESDASASVVLAITDTIDDVLLQRLRVLHRERGMAVVLVVGRLDPRALLSVVEAGVCAVVARAGATPERLVRAMRASLQRQAELPPQLVRNLLDHVGQLDRDVPTPSGLSIAGLTSRERDVLELIAEGHSTREVALRLSYSERTIKNILQDLTVRLNLRNRTQAVAYALRHGWI